MGKPKVPKADSLWASEQMVRFEPIKQKPLSILGWPLKGNRLNSWVSHTHLPKGPGKNRLSPFETFTPKNR